ncbi:hypothetical protein NMD99_01680 [Wolbachia endosymbiont of Listronotus oregonensis]|uniref:WD_0033/WD_0034 family tandem repeat-containing protein n=1 Tax=unclassified Wolbachia TaxID=2640676 RepID=UPI00222F5B77|nr:MULTISPECIES: hypothetical protein [unclassified Wolbachia]WMT84745.1 hypothetical protein NMD99_01680 [Wolbachia endosymbiont of Listronotus oregonensis]
MKTSKLTLVCDIYELTNKDRKNIQKLARKIEEGEGVAEKFRNRIFKKSSYNASTILLAKITYEYQGREETLSLLHYAISHKNNQAVKDLLEEAKKQKLLKEVLNEEITTKHSDGREETHTILTDAISRRDNDMIRAVLKISEENGILKEIVKKRITIKHSNGEEMTYTPFTYAEARKNSEAVEEILKFSGELVSRRATQKPTVVTAKTTTARSEKVLQDTIGNIETPADAYENSNKSSLEESIEHEYLEPCENSNESNTIAIEHIAASIEKLDNTGICEKNETAVTETDIQEPNASNSLSSAACFDNGSSKENTADKKEKPSMQQRRAILAGSVGAALLVSSVVAYILKMYAIAIIGGSVGLACISFALYDALKPSTQLEKVENVEQLDVKSLPSL